MPSRKSDARRSDVSPAVADASSPTARADSSVPSTSPPPRAEESEENTTTEGTKRSKEAVAAAAAVDLDKMTIEDLTLPKSIITRLAKGVLPANTQIQANAIMAMSKSATVFISYLAAYANEITLNANKKTIMPADVFKALEIIEFDFLKEPLQAEFAKFNAIQTDKRNTYRQKVKAAVKTPGDDVEMGGGGGRSEDRGVGDKTTTLALSDGDDAPRSKKARVEASPADAEETDAEDPEDEDAAEEMDDEEEDEEEQEDEEQEEHRQDSGDETQDTLEEMADVEQEDADEAMDGDESD
ncbi:CBF NF-Y family transcription [Cordyceps militaris]|uniref:DNA polymerase epsilon subunit D n=1 Tax=Cordyceps militaris TaxID=73501 RepID=A0A2H4SEK4_CORMI|nr:CBF NF-Y family transcription [Cordyceps militaris]